MAKSTIETLEVAFEARLQAYDRAMAKAAATADKAASEIEKRFDRTESHLSKFGERFGEIGSRIVEAFAAEKVIEFLTRTVENIAKLGTMAQQAGVSVGDLQKALFAGAASGVGADRLVEAFAKLNLELGRAQDAGSALGRILKDNGKSIADLQNDPVQALQTIADLYKNARTEADRAIIGNAAFGRGFRDLTPLLVQGSEGIAKLMGEAEKTGAVISDSVVKRAKELEEKIAELGLAWRAGLGNELLSTVRELLHIIEIVERLQKAMGAGSDLLGSLARAAGADWIHRQLMNMGLVSLPPAPPQHHPTPHSDDSTDVESAQMKAAAEARKKAEEDYLKHVVAIQKVIDELQGESAQLTRTARDQAIYNALKKAGIDANSEFAGRVAEVAGKLYDEQQALHDLTDNLDLARDSTKDFLSTLIDGLKEGKSLTDALAAAFQSLADKLANRALDKFVDALLGPSGTAQGGVLGDIFGFGQKPVPATSGRGPTVPIEPVTEKVLGTIPKQLGPTVPIEPVTQTSNPLLDLIARSEGTANQPVGGYNTSLGYGRFLPGGEELNLTSMTLDQVRRAQSAILTQTRQLDPSDPLYNSSAIGRYQFTRSTLDDLRAQNGLTGSEMFTPELQDKLALSLAQQRGTSVESLRSTWQGLNNVPSSDIASAMSSMQQGADQIAQSLSSAGQTTAAAAVSFTARFGPALLSILSKLPIFGGASGSGLATIGGARAAGGDVSPGTSYLVGERGPEIFRPSTPGHIMPHLDPPRGGSSSDTAPRFIVEARPNPYFDIRVRQISGQGDARTLDAARRSYPGTAAGFSKLGTVPR